VLVTKLRKKGANEDIDKAIKDIQDRAAEDGVEDVLVPAADAFMTAICRAGAKSLSHVLSCIERGKDQLLSMAKTSEAARRQIVASVVDYWRDQPGVAVRIIDILLNYTVLAPLTVVQWALGDNLGEGEALSKAWVYEMVSNTVAKVTSRNRQIALARFQKGLPQEQVAMVEATLAKDRDSARDLFKYIENAVQGVLEKESDNSVEQSADFVSLSAEDPHLIQAWATRWKTVFRRKAQVEESVVGEQAVEAKVKLIAAGPEPELMDQDNDAKAVANGGDEEML
jgi:nuclear cap-binding protein subunit 1